MKGFALRPKAEAVALPEKTRGGIRSSAEGRSAKTLFGASAPNGHATRRVAGPTRVEKRKPEGKAFRDFVLKAGEGIRTLDIHLGKVTLYH